MAVTYKGVIAGIGSNQDDINVILPEFDAKLRKFEVGKNTILEGFEYNSSTGYLSSGYCLVEGYVGGNKENIPIQESNYVYGIFTINHDKNIPDSFKIEIHDSPISTPRQDDILNVAGKYYYLLYPQAESIFVGNIVRQGAVTAKLDIIKFGKPITAIAVDKNGTLIQNVLTSINPSYDGRIEIFNYNPIMVYDVYILVTYVPWKYPLNAVYSDYTTVVEENGRLENNVTCPTQKVNDNSTRVANTEYVHNQIEEEINYDILVLGESTNPLLNAFTLERKAKFAVGRAYLIVDEQSYQSGQVLYTFPDGWKPKEKVTLGNGGLLSTSNGRWTVYIDTDGKVYGEQTTNNTNSTLINLSNFGYKIK